jgi:4-diphosphocytidyl-2-C-methyl-D-erythritol kinase
VYGLHDELEVKPNPDPSLKGRENYLFTQEGIAVDCNPEDNLIIKCYRNFAKKYSKVGNVAIRFKKNIPFGAGLGGGSSDAAHMAMALNELFELGLTKEELAAEVKPLGADCPFFIYNTPCYAEGIGDMLTPIDLDLKGVRIVLVKPDEGVSTKEAYSGIKPLNDTNCVRLMSAGKLLNGDAASQINDIFRNDFEATVFPKHPVIADIKKRLLDAGAFYASMSGSGSTVFGLFKDDAEGRTHANLRLLEQEFASMVLLNDTFGEWKS